MSLRALVYADQGICELSLFHTTRLLSSFGFHPIPIKAKEIILGKLQKSPLLVMPGGAARFYAKELGQLGNREISHFVKQGGTYLGICAGAYYGGAKTEFDVGGPLEITTTKDLGFFPDGVKGPAFGGFVYNSQAGARAAYLKGPFFKKRAAIYCNGGGYFLRAREYSTVKILAHYDELIDKPAAIVLCTIGKGKALLSGVHFEYDLTLLNDPALNPILPTLKTHEKEREELLKHIRGILCPL